MRCFLLNNPFALEIFFYAPISIDSLTILHMAGFLVLVGQLGQIYRYLIIGLS